MTDIQQHPEASVKPGTCQPTYSERLDRLSISARLGEATTAAFKLTTVVEDRNA